MSVEPLFIERILDASRKNVWRCWTEADLLRERFTPRPYTVHEAEIDLRPGGVFRVVMQSPEGDRFDNPGQILAVSPEEKLITSDAYVGDWQPGEKPFLTSIVRLSDSPDGKTHFRWEARHWSEEDRKSHMEMGFEQGWNAAADQLEQLAGNGAELLRRSN